MNDEEFRIRRNHHAEQEAADRRPLAPWLWAGAFAVIVGLLLWIGGAR